MCNLKIKKHNIAQKSLVTHLGKIANRLKINFVANVIASLTNPY